MHRLFVGIRPPAPVCERLLALMGGVSGARWQNEDQLHLTLRFIGEVDRHLAQDVHAALGSVHHPSFELSLSGIGAFDRRSEPTVLWVGVTPADPVKALQKKVEQALARVGLEPERRAFHPHITLARLPRGAGTIQPLLEASGGVSGPAFEVADFCLFESRLTAQGAVYAILERFPLSGLR
jgi:2'-5' RNA ligase